MKTFEDIEKLAMHDPAVRSIWIMYKHEEITKEEALINMVLVLSEQKDHYFNEVVKLHQNSTRPLV